MPKLALQLRRTPAFCPADSRVIISDPDDNPVAFGSRRGPEHWVSVPERAAFRFRAGSELVVAHPHPLADDDAVLDAYHGAALPIAVQVALGGQTLHASAVVADAGALVFCGDSYAGKTTLAFALSRRGYRIWADDVLAFEARSADGVRGVRLPFRLNLRAPTAAHFNAVPGEVSSADGGSEEWTRVPLAAVFALERVELSEPGSRPAPRRLSPGAALMTVLSHAFCFQPQTPQERRTTLADYLELVARVPVYSLTGGQDLGMLDALLDEVEATVPASAARSRTGSEGGRR